jgi:serine/threonine protein kinase/Tfp pilus assembly protein PilF
LVVLRRSKGMIMRWPVSPAADVTPHPHQPAPDHPDPRAEQDDSWAASVSNKALPGFALRSPPPSCSWGESKPADFPEVDSTFLGFQLVGELGRGAFGRVYLARQDDLAQRLVALKVSTDVQAESNHLAQLQHTHIVPVYSIHRAGPLQAVCMPYFGSATLADVLADLRRRQGPPHSGKGLVSTIQDRLSRTKANLARTQGSGVRTQGSAAGASLTPDSCLLTPGPDEQPVAPSALLEKQELPAKPAVGSGAAFRLLEDLTWTEAVLQLGERLADGLAHAHERGILHRDLKPANILLTDDGQPMLLDFNLSADTKRDVSRARIGGTLPYMAPEHLAAFAGAPVQGAEPDDRSDVYALGVILFELLTGRLPHRYTLGHSPEQLSEMIRDRLGPPPSLRRWNRAISPAVESIIQHCLEPEPAQRYQSARQLVEDLERQRTHQPLAHARERSLRERGGKFLRRNRRRVVLTGALLAVALIATLTAGLLARDARLRREQDRARLRSFDDANEEANMLLSGRTRDVEQRQAGLEAANQALARYGVLERADWRSQPEVRRLPSEDRERLVRSVGELLLLAATADETSEKELIERAAECFGPDQAPRAFYAYLEERARRKGDREVARDFALEAERRPIQGATDHYLLGRKFVDAGEFPKAIEHLREAVKLDQNHFPAWHLLGNCYLEGREFHEAITCYTVCIGRRPKFYGSYFNRGLARMDLHQYDKAEADFDLAVERQPKAAEVYRCRGLAREAQVPSVPQQRQTAARTQPSRGRSVTPGQGKLREALADLDQAIELGCQTSQVWFERSRVRRKLNDNAGADRDHQEGLKRSPRSVEGFILRGVMRAAKDPAGALADFREAVRLNPYSLAGWYNQAYILGGSLGKTRQAVAALDEVVKRYPKHSAARASRGLLLAGLGERAAAHRDVKEACTRSGNSADVLYQAACAYSLTSRIQPADKDEAFRLLALALERGFGHDRMATERDLEPLRAEPRFANLLEAVKTIKAKGQRQPPRRPDI